jgi:hypothetical protein
VVFVCKKIAILVGAMILFELFSFPVSAVDVSAKASVLIAQLDWRVLYAKNADARLPIASTTKIMTALIAAQRCRFDESMTVVPEAVRVEDAREPAGALRHLRVAEAPSWRDDAVAIGIRGGEGLMDQSEVHTRRYVGTRGARSPRERRLTRRAAGR